MQQPTYTCKCMDSYTHVLDRSMILRHSYVCLSTQTRPYMCEPDRIGMCAYAYRCMHVHMNGYAQYVCVNRN